MESVQYQNIGGSRGIPDELVVQISEVFDNSTARHLVYIDLGENRAYQQHKFDPPLRLKAGSYLGSNRIEGFYIWRGLLVDPSELFAQLDIELEKPAVEGGQMVAKAKVSSPRPARVEIESSENMEEFVAESSAAVVRLTEPGEFEAKVATNGAEQKFIKATAKVRP
ncbi:MAG: hypothetical protein Q7Q71_08755 [Verrucomicrobiota bacterium JB023]|nr:hypothetical protein [Verrucomicrobiota bacterium JB023]